MNRRNFFRTMVGGVATAAAVRQWPFRVFSFPTEIVKPQQYVRFIRAFDPLQNRMVNRWDVLYGFGVLPPLAEFAIQGRTVADVMSELHSHPGIESDALAELQRMQINRIVLA